MPDNILNGVTKNDLLKLKNSKAVPITAHSHEVVVPVVYATRVKQFMKREGMRVPLEPEELSALKKKARDTEGTMDASMAVGGTIKPKKKKSKKEVKKGTVIKKGNIKQVVNIKLGSRVIRTPSTRAKVLGKENIPIRPGVSSYPMTTEPAYSRMIPSTGAFIQPTKPQSLMIEDAKPPLSSSVVKPGSMPLVLRPPSIPPPPLMRPPSIPPPALLPPSSSPASTITIKEVGARRPGTIELNRRPPSKIITVAEAKAMKK